MTAPEPVAALERKLYAARWWFGIARRESRNEPENPLLSLLANKYRQQVADLEWLLREARGRGQ